MQISIPLQLRSLVNLSDYLIYFFQEILNYYLKLLSWHCRVVFFFKWMWIWYFALLCYLFRNIMIFVWANFSFEQMNYNKIISTMKKNSFFRRTNERIFSMKRTIFMKILVEPKYPPLLNLYRSTCISLQIFESAYTGFSVNLYYISEKN